MTWRLTIPWWEEGVKAKAKVETKAKLKVEAQVKNIDLATDNFLVGGWGEGKGKGGDKGKVEGGGKGKGQ
jgi:hypothetical protein